MSINFDVVISSPEHSVEPDYSIDMKSGLDTLQGISGVTRYIAEAVLTERVVEKLSYKSDIKTSLKETFRGSYGHIYSLDIYNKELKNKFRQIGERTFLEIIRYFINESLYLENYHISDEAQCIINNLGEKSEELINLLRLSSLKKIHEISIKFYCNVKLRLRENELQQTEIFTFNQSTILMLQAKESTISSTIIARITRLNIHTGNGRLSIKDKEGTTAFGFGVAYKHVTLKIKKKLSTNLDGNNGINDEDCAYLRILVKPIELNNGKIVKYIIKDLCDD